jgi:uncharacterized membrane protein
VGVRLRRKSDRYDYRVSRSGAPGIAAIAVTWLLLITSAPILWIPLAGVLYLAGALICHQLPERSFHLHGAQLPVCARCFGLYLGAAVGSMTGAVVSTGPLLDRVAPLARSRRSAWVVTAVAAAPTAITFVLEWGLGWPVSNVTRAIAAVPLGFTVALVVVRAVATLHYE